MIDFFNNIKNGVEEGLEYLKDILDVIAKIKDFILECLNFFPSPYKEMTIITITIIFAIIIYKLVRR